MQMESEMEKQKKLRERLLSQWGLWCAKNWGKSLIIGILITALMTFGVITLSLEMTFFSVLPASSTQVEDLKQIIADFPIASGITVVIDGRHLSDKEAENSVRRTVDVLEAELKKPEHSTYIKAVNAKIDSDFIKSNGLILAEPADIQRFSRLYQDLNLTPFFTNTNNDFEREYSGNEEALAADEEMAVSQFRGLNQLFSMLSDAAGGKEFSDSEISSVIDAYLYGDQYFMSRDNKMAMIIVQPTFDVEDIMMLEPGCNAIESIVKETAAEFGTRTGLTGLTVVAKDEMVTSEQGLAGSFLISLLLILLLLIFVFRMFSVPLISGIPLVMGIYWAMGMTGFTIHRLNIMTAMYLVALLGLGIDYAIHLLTTYTQELDSGSDFHTAVSESFRKSGSGIITGAFTTAIAFFSLSAAETELMRELGIVAGLGIIGELASMMLFIPALLGFRHHRNQKRGKTEAQLFSRIRIKTNLASGLGRFISKAPLMTASVLIIFCLALSSGAGRVEIENNLMNMEAEGLESVELQDVMVEEFSMAPDSLFILAGSLEELKELKEQLEALDSIKRIDSAADMLLTEGELPARLAALEELRVVVEQSPGSGEIDNYLLTDELNRLQMNLLEMSDLAYLGGIDKLFNTINELTGWDEDGQKVAETALDELIIKLEDNPDGASKLESIQQRIIPLLRSKLLSMTTAQSAAAADLPELYRNSYISENGDYLMSVIPTRNPWEGEYREIYTSQIETVTDKATGMLLAADQLNIMAESDGRRTAFIALLAIFIILLIDFRNLKLTILTMLPLGAAFGALFGVMGWAGIKFDFINIIAVPLLIGIGVDDAVHISHRYLLEGRGRMDETISKTGSAVLLTSITTIIAFASFIPSVMRAMRSTGIVLSLAIAFAFIFSIMLHPSMLILAAERLNLKITPIKRRKK